MARRRFALSRQRRCEVSSRRADISPEQAASLSRPPKPDLTSIDLFLDFDGTLVDLIDRPDEVIADPELRDLLDRLNARLNGRLAVISGRSRAQLDTILGPVAQSIALSGSHGSEHRWDGVSAQPRRPSALDEAAVRLRPFVDGHPGMLLEEKTFGVALHYRQCPDAERLALEQAGNLAAELDLHLQNGKMMVELRAPGDKGLAVRQLMRQPFMQGSVPIFVGDDRTDEAAFEAVAELGGHGILVGPAHKTAAAFRLRDPAAVRAWLQEALA